MRTEPAPVEALDLHVARDAISEGRWTDAVERFRAADEQGRLGADDLDSYGEAIWWTGRIREAIQVRERAFAAHQAAGDVQRAAVTGLALVNYNNNWNGTGVASGWARRVERLLDGRPESKEHGGLARIRLNMALHQGDLDAALASADEMLAIGSRVGDRDLEVMGLQDRARVLIAMGDVEVGLRLLDEAVVAAVSGDVSRYSTAVVYCNATIACEDLTDYRRARDFAQVAERWCASQSISGFPGMCRVRRVELLRLRGAWGEAESEARKACVELADFSLGYAAEGHYQIGEIRLRMGDLAGAEAAFTESHRLGREPLPGLALARLAAGKVAAAGTLLAGALAQRALVPLERAKLLPAEVEVAVALHDVGRAERATTELEAIAAKYGTEILRALAETARGTVALANGEDEVAVDMLRRAVRSWQSNDAPYEIARARLLLGSAYRSVGDDEHAALELGAATGALEALGAAGDLARIRAEGFGVPAAETPGVDKAPRERKATRTFMFTDIVGSTALIEAIGDDAWRRLQTWHDETIRQLLREHDGQEIHHAGDGFFVAFERPDAAISCAIAIRETLSAHRDRSGFAPAVRIGLHTAEAVRTASGYEGGGVHAAARVGALAAGGQVLIARSTADAAMQPVVHGPWRTEHLRGFREPVELAVLG